jgi:hypothetical protein
VRQPALSQSLDYLRGQATRSEELVKGRPGGTSVTLALGGLKRLHHLLEGGGRLDQESLKVSDGPQL